MKFQRFFIFALAAFGLAMIGGCGGGGSNAQQLTSEDREKMKPQNDFEATKNVAITADTHFAAGQFCETQGNLDLAMKQYEEALKLNPKHRDSLYRSAIVYVKQRKLPEAIETWTKYVAATDGDASAYANLGFAYELSSRSADAEVAYMKGIHRDPTNAACRVNYGLMLARKERFNEAILQLQTVLTDAEVHYNLASVYETLGRRQQAKIEYRKALTADPDLKDAQARLDAMH